MKFIYILLSVFIVGCSNSFEIEKPKEMVEVTKIKAKSYYINIPISISIKKIENILIEAIDKNIKDNILFEENNIRVMSNIKVDIRLDKLSNPIVLADKNTLQVKLSVRANIVGRWKKKLLFFKISKHKSTYIDFTIMANINPIIDENYNIKTNIKLNYNIDKIKKFKIGYMTFNLQNIIDKNLAKQIDKIEDDFDNILQQNVNIKNILYKSLKRLNNPITISQKDKIWIVIRPKAFYITPLIVDKDRVLLNIGLKAKTKIRVGKKPHSSKKKIKLPKIYNKKIDDIFKINVPINIKYSAIKERLEEKLLDKEITIKNNQVIFKKFKVYGSNRADMVVAIYVKLQNVSDFWGMEGWIYLRGKPVFDKSKNIIEMKNFRFNIKSKNKLFNIFSTAINPMIKTKIQSLLKYNLTKDIDNIKDIGNKYLENLKIAEDTNLSGNLDKFILDDIVIQPKKLQLIIKAQGKLLINIDLSHSNKSPTLKSGV